MQQIGKRITCDRCGKSIFMLFTGTKSAGFTDIDSFENTPEGWTLAQPVYTHEHVDLCPECAEVLAKMSNNFMKNRPEDDIYGR